MTYPSAHITSSKSLEDQRNAVTLIAGLNSLATRDIVDHLLHAEPSAIVITHELTEMLATGTVYRQVRDVAGTLEEAQFRPEHPCLSCTLRDDLLPTLVRLAETHPGRSLLVALPAAVEPEAVASVCQWCLVDGKPVTDSVRLDSVVTVCDSASIRLSMESPDDLRDRGLNAADNDHRALADVACRQIEFADTVVLWTARDDLDFDDARTSVLLQRLNPWAVHLHTFRLSSSALSEALLHTGRFNAEVPEVLGRGLEGYGVGISEPAFDCGVNSTVFRTRRPFHPQRLHEVLDSVVGDSVRGRGHFWLATQPDTAIAWESAGGGLSMGSLGNWMAATPDADWLEFSDQRRVFASLNWEDKWGDRDNQLAFIGVGMDVEKIHRWLSYALLTNDEVKAGRESWRTWHDPFAGCFATDDEIESAAR